MTKSERKINRKVSALIVAVIKLNDVDLAILKSIVDKEYNNRNVNGKIDKLINESENAII